MITTATPPLVVLLDPTGRIDVYVGSKGHRMPGTPTSIRTSGRTWTILTEIDRTQIADLPRLADRLTRHLTRAGVAKASVEWWLNAATGSPTTVLRVHGKSPLHVEQGAPALDVLATWATRADPWPAIASHLVLRAAQN